MPDAPERADDLIGDEQHVVLVADLAHALEVAGGRREAAARVLHRLEEHGRDGLGALEEDHLLDAIRGPDAERLEVVCRCADFGRPVEVRVRHAEATRRDGLEHLLHRRDARDRQRALRGSVVRDRARDHLVLGRAALELPVVLRELECRLDGLAAAGREEHAIEVARRVLRETVGELDRSRVRVRPDREERELLGLLRRHLRESRTAVAGVHHEEPRQPVEVLLPLDVVDVVALAPGDDRHARGLHGGLPGEVHPEVVLRLLLKVGVVVTCAAEARRRVEGGHFFFLLRGRPLSGCPSCRTASGA